MNRKTLGTVLLLALALKVGFALAIPLTPDEGLHWMQSRHLTWGFRDHPPGTAFMNSVGRFMFGVSLMGVRLPAILSTTLCSLIAFAILKEIRCSEESACAGAVLLQIMPMFAFGLIMVPVFPFAALILAAEYFFIRALRSRGMMDHLLWGFFLGVSTMTYYIAATAVLAVAAFCLAGGSKESVFRQARFWAGAALAAAIVAPNVWWNAGQGRESAVYFQILQRSPYGLNIRHAFSYVILCVLIAGPLVLPAFALAAKGLFNRSFAGAGRAGLFTIFVAVPFLGFLLVSFFREAGAHWAVVSFLNVPLLLASRQKPPGYAGRRWLKAAAVYASVIAAAAVVLLAVGLRRCVTYIDPEGDLISHRKTALLFGAESAARAAHSWKELLSRQGRDITFATDRWGYAGILSFYTPGNPYYVVFPPPSRHGQDYRLWNLKSPPSSDTIFVSSRPLLRKEVKAACADVESLGEGDTGQSSAYSFHLCTGFRPGEG